MSTGYRRARGFTLLEVLIAFGIFALASAMAYMGLNQVLKVRDRLDVEREFQRSLTVTFFRLEEDLSQARLRPVRGRTGAVLPAFEVRDTDTRALGAPSLSLTRGGVFVFPPIAKEGDDPRTQKIPPRSDLQRVAYRLNENTLWRITWPQLDQAPTSESSETALLRDVEAFEVVVFDEKGNRQKRWPPLSPGALPTTPTVLPRGAEVKIVLRERGEYKRLFLIHE